MTSFCPACGQPLPLLTPIQRRILEAVRRRPGVDSETLRAIIWDGPNGGPECRKTIHVHISKMNRRLAAHRLRVRGSLSDGYRIEAVL
jgi:hypothetical protein